MTFNHVLEEFTKLIERRVIYFVLVARPLHQARQAVWSLIDQESASKQLRSGPITEQPMEMENRVIKLLFMHH
jgi:hypothetical protein